MNVNLAPASEGMSFVLPLSDELSKKISLESTQDLLGSGFVSSEFHKKYGGRSMSSKYFEDHSKIGLLGIVLDKYCEQCDGFLIQ